MLSNFLGIWLGMELGLELGAVWLTSEFEVKLGFAIESD